MSHLVQRYCSCSGPHPVRPWEGPVASRPLVCSAHTLRDRIHQHTIPGRCQPYGIGPMGYNRSGIARHRRSSRCPCSETSGIGVPLATLHPRDIYGCPYHVRPSPTPVRWAVGGRPTDSRAEHRPSSHRPQDAWLSQGGNSALAIRACRDPPRLGPDDQLPR